MKNKPLYIILLQEAARFRNVDLSGKAWAPLDAYPSLKPGTKERLEVIAGCRHSNFEIVPMFAILLIVIIGHRGNRKEAKCIACSTQICPIMRK